MRLLLAAAALLSALVAGCAPQPYTIAASSPEDQLKTCGELRAELMELRARIGDMGRERAVGFKNDGAIFLAPVTLGYTLQWLDGYPVNERQLTAFEDRYAFLGTYAMRRGCRVQNEVSAEYTYWDSRLYDTNINPLSPPPIQGP